MPLVVGVSFKKAGKVYYFDPAGIDLHEGDFVIAETARGIEFGEVMLDPKDVSNEEIVSPLRKVVRKATEGDMRREESNREKEKRAFAACQQKIQSRKLPKRAKRAQRPRKSTPVTMNWPMDCMAKEARYCIWARSEMPR
jgi:cell fate regulator YaaT (PSP1 superfamily)